MATIISEAIAEVFDMALVTIRDYKIDTLYNTSQEQWELYLLGILKRATPKFNKCRTDLTLVETETEEEVDDGEGGTETITTTSYDFSETPTYIEISILADIMVYIWLEREINNINQINLHLLDNDFKHYAESQNLDKKISYRDRLYEQYSQAIQEYCADKYFDETTSW
jgi:hypothetical protein